MLFILNSVLFGFALAMDAFSVSVANGIAQAGMSRKRELIIAGTFGIFQAFMPMAGWFLVRTVADTFEAFGSYIPYIAFFLLFYIGGRMVLEGVRELKGKKERQEKILGKGELLIQGVATSIDALSVGFTIAHFGAAMAGIEALIIGVETFVICLAGLKLGSRAGKLIKKGRAEIVGGIILIIIGFGQITGG